MKKVLFATTALVASAGIASAQGVEVSGSAEMGVFGGTNTDLQFHTDIDVTFTMSGETDNGLSFGAAVDLDESTIADTAAGGSTNGAFGNDADDGGVAIFISGDFGKLTMGDTDGAFDWAMREVNLVGGSINDAETGHTGFNGNAGLDGNYDGQIAAYTYSFNSFSFAISAEIDDAGVGDPIFGIGGKYSGDMGGVTLGVGLGYQTGGPGANDEALGVSLDAAMGNGFSAGINYSQVTEGANEYTHIGVGVGYTMDALSVGLNYGQYDYTAASPTTDRDGFGLAVNYDLGGGAVVQFGYGSSSITGGASTDSYSLGVAMSF